MKSKCKAEQSITYHCTVTKTEDMPNCPYYENSIKSPILCKHFDDINGKCYCVGAQEEALDDFYEGEV
jgi:hypothetical protein